MEHTQSIYNFHSPITLDYAKSEQHINNKEKPSQLWLIAKLAETILLRPITSTLLLVGRAIKLITWDITKAGIYKLSGYHTKSAEFLELEYLKTGKALRDVLFIPKVVRRVFQDLTTPKEEFVDDLKSMPAEEYTKVLYAKSFQQFSTVVHGCSTFEVIHPKGITEFPATTDPILKTVMASHIFKPDIIAINFGSPNVATFVTESVNGLCQTVKVDAKSLHREPMTYHTTNGKIQSGVFLVPNNIPKDAIARFKEAAKKLQGRTDITCVNTNCRVLQEAGFCIEGVAMDGILFPGELMEHLLYRNVFYKDTNGINHKVRFDILNTTEHTLEKFFEDVDTAVVGTRLRHKRRHADTEENQKARGAAAQALIEEEKTRLLETASLATGSVEQDNPNTIERRKVTISVPSYLGEPIARIWGRHTMYELDLSDKQNMIHNAFESQIKDEPVKLQPFPHKNPSLLTRLKRDIFFSKPVVRFLRNHMMGQADVIYLNTPNVFKHLESTKGAHLNYVLLENKFVLARVNALGNNGEPLKKAADWALSKHGLLAAREDAYCSGEIWYDANKKRFMMNSDSGTYMPSNERVKITVSLANHIFNTSDSHTVFEAVLADKGIIENTK